MFEWKALVKVLVVGFSLMITSWYLIVGLKPEFQSYDYKLIFNCGVKTWASTEPVKHPRACTSKWSLVGIAAHSLEYLANILYPIYLTQYWDSWPQWLSWMHRPTGDQEVAGSTSTEVGNILSWRLIMKYFLRSFSPFRWFKKGSCQFLAREYAQYWLTA